MGSKGMYTTLNVRQTTMQLRSRLFCFRTCLYFYERVINVVLTQIDVLPGEGLPYESDGDARRKIRINP